MILLLMRRSTPRTRVIIGATLVALGVALIAETVALSTGFPVLGIIMTVNGGLVLASGIAGLRHARAAR
jgi:hypothetical protein